MQAQPKADQSKGFKVIKMLELMGHQLGMPYKKDIKGDDHLKELRTPTGTRIYYFFFDGAAYHCVWAGNKKTQEKDIQKAKSIIIEMIGGKHV